MDDARRRVLYHFVPVVVCTSKGEIEVVVRRLPVVAHLQVDAVAVHGRGVNPTIVHEVGVLGGVVNHVRRQILEVDDRDPQLDDAIHELRVAPTGLEEGARQEGRRKLGRQADRIRSFRGQFVVAALKLDDVAGLLADRSATIRKEVPQEGVVVLSDPRQ